MNETPAPRRTVPALVTLGGLIVVGPLSLAIFIPTLPAVRAEFGADLQVVQLTLSLPFLAVVLVPLFAGAASDRVGRRPVLLGSLAALLAGCMASYAADGIWTLVIGRTVVGVAGTCCLIVARAVVNDWFGRKALARAMANFTVAPVVALLVAPMIGGVLTDVHGWRSVFAVLAGAVVVVAAMTLALLRETRSPPAGAARSRGAMADVGVLLRSPPVLGYTLFSAFHFAVAVGFIAEAPYLMVNQLHCSTTEYGVGLMTVILGMLAGVAAAARIPPRYGIAPIVLGGALFALFAGVSMAAVLGIASLSPIGLFAPTAFVAFGIGVAMPAGQAGIVGTIPELAGTASGVSGFMQMLLAAAFTHLVALPWPHPDWALAGISIAGLTLATGFALIPALAARRSRARTP